VSEGERLSLKSGHEKACGVFEVPAGQDQKTRRAGTIASEGAS
jgi:hypothetical protein